MAFGLDLAPAVPSRRGGRGLLGGGAALGGYGGEGGCSPRSGRRGSLQVAGGRGGGSRPPPEAGSAGSSGLQVRSGGILRQWPLPRVWSSRLLLLGARFPDLGIFSMWVQRSSFGCSVWWICASAAAGVAGYVLAVHCPVAGG
ncbi:hypothetical protein VPH35_025971 [Triticum aestivum]